VLEGGEDADVLNGGDNGAGGDTLSYASSDTGVTVNLDDNTFSGGDAEGDTISNFENILGSANADTLTGDDFDNIIEGGAGADVLNGGDNGAGGDTISYAGSDAGVTVSLAAQTASGGDAEGEKPSSTSRTSSVPPMPTR